VFGIGLGRVIGGTLEAVKPQNPQPPDSPKLIEMARVPFPHKLEVGVFRTFNLKMNFLLLFEMLATMLSISLTLRIGQNGLQFVY